MEERRKPDPKGKEESARHRNRKLSICRGTTAGIRQWEPSGPSEGVVK